MKHQISFLFNELGYFLDDLKQMHFDMLIIDKYDDMQFVANYLEIPIVVKVIEGVIDPTIL